MLEKTLAEANREARKRRSRFTLFLIIITTLVGLFLFGIIKLDLTIFEDALPPPVVEKPAEITSSPSKILMPPENVESNVTSAIPEQTEQPIKAPVKTTRSNDSIDIKLPETKVIRTPLPLNDVKRDEFKRILSSFNAELLPEIEQEGFSAWNPTILDMILADRDVAIGAFAAGDYETAISIIEEITERSEENILAYDVAFQQAIDGAATALQFDDYEAASTSIDQALRLNPNAEEAFALKARIDRLPEVLPLVQQAAIARTENNLNHEKDILKRVLELDPSRTNLKQRFDEVNSLLLEERFTGFIENGMKDINKRQLSSAQNNLQLAQQIFKIRDEVKFLSSQVAVLKQELDVESLIAKGLASSGDDDWVIAAQHFSEAGRILPNNKDASDGLRLATTIILLQNETAQHLSSPHRLSSENVSFAVKSLLEKTIVYSAFSPFLKSSSTQLKELHIAYSIPVSITVISDGQTDVSVRGVGQVGKTNRRKIKLKPGNYAFEGKRRGFKSKLIQLDVPPGIVGLTVEIVCDERI